MKTFKTIINIKSYKYTGDKISKQEIINIGTIIKSIITNSTLSGNPCSHKYNLDTHTIEYTFTVPDTKTTSEIDRVIRNILPNDINCNIKRLVTIPITTNVTDIFDLLYN